MNLRDRMNSESPLSKPTEKQQNTDTGPHYENAVLLKALVFLRLIQLHYTPVKFMDLFKYHPIMPSPNYMKPSPYRQSLLSPPASRGVRDASSLHRYRSRWKGKPSGPPLKHPLPYPLCSLPLPCLCNPDIPSPLQDYERYPTWEG